MRAFAPIRPTFFRSPPPAIPTTRVEKISGAMIDLIRLRKMSRRKKILLPQSGLSQPMIPPNTNPITIWVVSVGLYQGRTAVFFLEAEGFAIEFRRLNHHRPHRNLSRKTSK